MSDDSLDYLEKVLTNVAEKLGEHFCSVQIVAVANNTDGDRCVAALSAGTGSYYERLAATREWVLSQEEYIKERARIVQRRELGEDE